MTPLLGSIMRPVGGRLADRLGGATVTAATFAAMIAGGSLIVVASVNKVLWLFIVGFVALFVLTGIGNGSIYKLIPTIFRNQAQASLAANGGVAAGVDTSTIEQTARRRTRALIGLTGAIGSFGGVLVNLALRQSFLSSGSGTRAYVGFIAFYSICLALTWFVYCSRTARSNIDGSGSLDAGAA